MRYAWRHAFRNTLAAVALFGTLGCPTASWAVDLREALGRYGFPAAAADLVMAGQFVDRDLPTASDRDLNVGIAFLIKQAPDIVTRRLHDEATLLRSDPGEIAFGELKDEGGLDQLVGLKLTGKQVSSYSAAAAGSDLNLSTAEIAMLHSAGSGPAALQKSVQGQLLARYRAYRASGLAGIATYARGGSMGDPAADLRSDNAVIRSAGRLPGSLCALLEKYPASKPTDFQEKYLWSQFTAHGEDTLALVHTMMGTFDGQLVAVQRQFYVSTGYNVEQAIVGFLPVDGGTLVLYTNHTSTDQVAGWGGSTKRSIGRKLMASQLQSLFDKTRTALAK